MGLVKNYLKYIRLLLTSLLLISFSFKAVAQEDDECLFNPHCDVDPEPDDGEAPLDSGVAYLIVIGLTYTIILIRKTKLKKRIEDCIIEED